MIVDFVFEGTPYTPNTPDKVDFNFATDVVQIVTGTITFGGSVGIRSIFRESVVGVVSFAGSVTYSANDVPFEWTPERDLNGSWDSEDKVEFDAKFVTTYLPSRSYGNFFVDSCAQEFSVEKVELGRFAELAEPHENLTQHFSVVHVGLISPVYETDVVSDVTQLFSVAGVVITDPIKRTDLEEIVTQSFSVSEVVIVDNVILMETEENITQAFSVVSVEIFEE